VSDEEVDDREFVPNEVLASRQLGCPSCGYAPSAVQGFREDARPRFEDRTLCWSCGAIGIYTKTPLGHWTMRPPTQEERAELRANPEVRKARDQWKRAKLEGRGPGSIGYDAGGAPRPADRTLVILATEPKSWTEAAEKHGLIPTTVRQLQQWVRQQLGSDVGSVELPCGACGLTTMVPPTAQQALFEFRAKVLCAVCAAVLHQKMNGERP
jgi:hypothetical protein